ncbi:hypothetical protein cyc_03475 [Cyclospora cayetanensis]|uniref:Uncharacterized protein n=1 Tax=Cyclospora cayetanensis TaxID=88456 RepID=A0A1D3DB21_9EIME|nr:hypothetical protein cyc_03475 [Cyclospora cayetanensis]
MLPSSTSRREKQQQQRHPLSSFSSFRPRMCVNAGQALRDWENTRSSRACSKNQDHDTKDTNNLLLPSTRANSCSISNSLSSRSQLLLQHWTTREAQWCLRRDSSQVSGDSHSAPVGHRNGEHKHDQQMREHQKLTKASDHGAAPDLDSLTTGYLSCRMTALQVSAGDPALTGSAACTIPPGAAVARSVHQAADAPLLLNYPSSSSFRTHCSNVDQELRVVHGVHHPRSIPLVSLMRKKYTKWQTPRKVRQERVQELKQQELPLLLGRRHQQQSSGRTSAEGLLEKNMDARLGSHWGLRITPDNPVDLVGEVISEPHNTFDLREIPTLLKVPDLQHTLWHTGSAIRRPRSRERRAFGRQSHGSCALGNRGHSGGGHGRLMQGVKGLDVSTARERQALLQSDMQCNIAFLAFSSRISVSSSAFIPLYYAY